MLRMDLVLERDKQRQENIILKSSQLVTASLCRFVSQHEPFYIVFVQFQNVGPYCDAFC